MITPVDDVVGGAFAEIVVYRTKQAARYLDNASNIMPDVPNPYFIPSRVSALIGSQAAFATLSAKNRRRNYIYLFTVVISELRQYVFNQ